jgi:hypothetical protein
MVTENVSSAKVGFPLGLHLSSSVVSNLLAIDFRVKVLMPSTNLRKSLLLSQSSVRTNSCERSLGVESRHMASSAA